jgi:hypothetical protein
VRTRGILNTAGSMYVGDSRCGITVGIAGICTTSQVLWRHVLLLARYGDDCGDIPRRTEGLLRDGVHNAVLHNSMEVNAEPCLSRQLDLNT